MSSVDRHKRSYSKMETNSAETGVPRKKASIAVNLSDQEKLDKMIQRIQARTYEPLLNEMKTNSKWSSKTFQATILKEFNNCAYEGEKLARSYLNLEECLEKAEKECTKLSETIQDQHQRVYEAEEQAESTEQKLESTKDELNAALLMNENSQIKIHHMEKELAQLKESLKMESEARKAAEKDAIDAKTQATENFAKWIREYEPKNDMNGLNETIVELKKDMEQLQNLTSNDVVQGIENLTKNLSSFFPAEKKEGPMWIVEKEIVESIRKSTQEVPESFIHDYLKRLFTWGERILPESYLNKNKLAECHAVIAYYYKVIGTDGQLYGTIVKKTLEKLRVNGRKEIYPLVAKQGTIGFTPEGLCFFYYRMPTGILEPFADANFLHPLKVQLYADRIYGIPADYVKSEFLMIIEKNLQNETAFHQVDPKSGYRKIVYSTKNAKKST